MRTSKILTIVGVVAGAVAIAFLIGWYASRDTSFPRSKADEISPAEAASKRISTSGEAEPVIETIPVAAATEETGSVAKTNLTAADWEDKADEILGGDLDEDKKALAMLEIYPHLSVTAKGDYMDHIINLMADDDFNKLTNILLDTKTPEGVSDTIMGDLANRPNVIGMPLLLQVAKTPNHPKAAEAKELLELYIEPEDELGDDWSKWEAEVAKYLEENPD